MRGAAVVLTFLFTDLVDSTRAWREHPQEMNAALAAHDDIVRTEIDRRGGTIFATGGDGFAAVFVAPDAALAAAVQMQRAIPAVADVAGLALAPRIGVHTGEAIARDGDYFGAHVNKAARIAALGHGGQIVLSGTTADLITRPPRATSFELRGEHRLKGFADPERIVELVLDERRTRFPPLRSLAPAVTNLPGVTTSFVGRDEELATLRTLLAQRPLVTLVAPGGSGKTRLAVEIARSLVDEYGDGVWFVDLADVSEPAAVAAAFLAVGDLSETAAPADIDSLTAALGSRRILIVADNCEQAVDAVAEVAGAVLARCPEARILATSRRPLGVVGEQQVRVTTLDTQGSGADVSPASRLFIDRARLVRPEYSPSHPEMATIDEICRRLDGLPLAIELAAARTGVFSVHDLAGRLDDARLLAGDRRVLRHRSLDAVVEWSHGLLGALDRRAFRRLAVFAGSWNLAAAEDVLPDDEIPRDEVAGALSRLVEHSLIAAEPASGVTRYRMLATIAAFASAKLDESGERETVRARLRDHFSAGLAARARDFEHFVWAAPADDVANVQAALECSIATQSPDQAAELLAYATPLLSVTSASSGWRSSFAANMTARLRASGTLTRRGREWIELSETVAAEIGGDFVVADELATRLRATTDDDVVLFISSFLYGHHRAAFDPAAAAAGFDRMTERFGPVPVTSWGRGEIALTEGRPGDAAGLLLTALGVPSVGDLARAQYPLELVMIVDLVCALLVAERLPDAETATDALVRLGVPAGLPFFGVLCQALIAGTRGDRVRGIERIDAALAEHRNQVSLNDCALAAMILLERTRPADASRLAGALRAEPQRSIGLIALRRHIVRRLRARAGDERYVPASRDGAARGVAALMDELGAELGFERRRIVTDLGQYR